MKLVPAVRARPKSRIFRVQSDFTTILLGLRSCRKRRTHIYNKLSSKSKSRWDVFLPYPVNNAGWVQMFDTAQHLVEQVGHSLVVELHLNHLAQVGVHQLHDEIAERRGEINFWFNQSADWIISTLSNIGAKRIISQKWRWHSFIIQEKNRIPPAASDYTYMFTSTDSTPGLLFPQVWRSSRMSTL